MTKRERIEPLRARPTGELVTIDRGVLAELVERLAEAIAAVERSNRRAVGVVEERACVAAVFATGATPASCAAR